MNQRDTPHKLTPAECRNRILDQIGSMVSYWEKEPVSSRDKLSGLAFSIVSMIDGVVGTVPPLDLIPRPHPGDETILADEGENWFPSGTVINGDVCLHETIHEFID
jgi:hypothetical protein